MPASRCVVQDCNNSSNPRQGISLHNSPTSANVLSSWKRFVSLHRKNFNPTGRFVICSEHFTDDCFARSYHVGGAMKRLVQGAIPSVWKKKYENDRTFFSRSSHGECFRCIYTFLSLLRFNISFLNKVLHLIQKRHDILVRTYSVLLHTDNLRYHVHVLICLTADFSLYLNLRSLIPDKTIKAI